MFLSVLTLDSQLLWHVYLHTETEEKTESADGEWTFRVIPHTYSPTAQCAITQYPVVHAEVKIPGVGGQDPPRGQNHKSGFLDGSRGPPRRGGGVRGGVRLSSRCSFHWTEAGF